MRYCNQICFILNRLFIFCFLSLLLYYVSNDLISHAYALDSDVDGELTIIKKRLKVVEQNQLSILKQLSDGYKEDLFLLNNRTIIFHMTCTFIWFFILQTYFKS